MKKFIIVALAFLFLLHHESRSQVLGRRKTISCDSVDTTGIRVCVYHIFPDTLEVVKQEHSDLCWAETISSVFSFYGHRISKEHIASNVFSGAGNVNGNRERIFHSLNKEWVDDDGKHFKVTAEVLVPNQLTAIEELIANHPIIVAPYGRIMILSSIISAGSAIMSATVQDPWPITPTPRNLSPREWLNISYMVRIRVKSD